MTKRNQTLIEKMEAARAQYGMRVLGEGTMKADGSKFYLVTSRQYATSNVAYIVSQHDGQLTCNCKATKPCVHITLVAQTLKDERQPDIHAECGDWCPIVRQRAAERQPEPTTHREMCFVCNRWMAFDGIGTPLCSEKCRKEHEWNNARMDAAHATEPSVGVCPQCGGAMAWADSVHNAMRCQSCQHLIAGVAAKQVASTPEQTDWHCSLCEATRQRVHQPDAVEAEILHRIGRRLAEIQQEQAFSIFAPSNGEALAGQGRGMIWRGQM